jgi:hypothetical protein
MARKVRIEELKLLQEMQQLFLKELGYTTIQKH